MSDPLRIVLIGQAAFGENVLNALIDSGRKVVAVFCPPGEPGRPPDALETAAQSRRIPVLRFPRMRAPEAIAVFAALKADLAVMAFVTDIVPEEILTNPTRGTIQYHPSLLPRHRGPSSINWPIIKGETKTGLTIFWPDAQLDTGPILLQKEVEILPEDTLGTVYFQKLFPMGVDALLEAVTMVENGNAPRIAQDESQATYEGWVTEVESAIDWSRPHAEIHNLIRGCDPNPGAHSTFAGKSVHFYGALSTGESAGVPSGQVIEVLEGGIRVAAGGGTLLIQRARGAGGQKVKAADWARSVNLSPGDRFGS